MRARQNSQQAGRRVLSRMMANRVLTLAALLAIVLGVALGQTFITWLNATLL
jgi:hypothetical protein